MTSFRSSFFADSGTDYSDARIAILGAPYDGTTSYRSGARNGPAAIRAVSYNFESYIPELDVDLGTIPFFDMGDIDLAAVPDIVVREVEEAVRGVAREGKVPVLLGGEHTVSIGGARALEPEAFIVCDAHLDLREEFMGTPFSHGCTTRRIYEDVTNEVHIIGARSGTAEQYAFARKMHLYTAGEILEHGIDGVLHTIKDAVAGKRVYLSIDADVIDCCLTPGVGTPEPMGLVPADIRAVIRVFAPISVGFDYVEVAPHDAGQTAAVAVSLIREYIALRGSPQV
ncbi:MAG: agmatinase [Methanomicrobiales archaeon]|nr:agmatinase [Methanomicrobiales archaeon]